MEYTDRVITELMKEGKDINEILNMPYHYIVQLLEDRQKPKEEKSIIAAFGGSAPR